MMNDTGYRLVVSLLDLFLWGGELVGEENLPEEGPAVFVTNHMGARGPIGVFCSLPMRLYPWTKLETMDRELAPQQVCADLVEGEWKLKPPLSGLVARAICALSVPFLQSLGCIPVYRTRQELDITFQQSLRLLQEEKYLVVAPEDPEQEPDPATGIRPFKKGFLRMGELYARETGQRLQFYPVTVHEIGKVFVEKPIAYNPLNEARSERVRVINLLERTIKARYSEVSASYTMTPVFMKR
jgi:hypothetical protein